MFNERYSSSPSIFFQNLHPHLSKIHVGARMKRLEEGAAVDWGLAEALAVGSLLYQGREEGGRWDERSSQIKVDEGLQFY